MQIDFIFTSPDLVASDYQVHHNSYLNGARNLSDHCMISARVALA